VTTLLQRMVMRTRAPLSSAQPATRPFFAPGDPGLALGVPDRSEGSAEAFPASPTAGPATRRLTGERAPEPRSEDADREVSADASTPARATPAGQRDGAEWDRRQESGEAPGSAAPLDQTGAGTAGRDEVMSAATPGRDEIVSATATPPAVPVSPAGSTEPASPSSLADQPPAPTAAGRVRRRQPSLRPPANEPAAAAPATALEVTISIGHIDVRAAPPPAPARSRPAFRPRVTLDEFLAASQDRRP
jgi:hypothetical protein